MHFINTIKFMNKKNYNITYLLGAGASALALPTINNIADKLKNRADNISFDIIESERKNKIFENIEIANKLIEDFIWLAEQTKIYGTPDTFAKFLYLNNPFELPRLKTTLSVYFLIEQLNYKKFDIRTLVFLINIIERRLIFPENIKILSWNYDFQMELASYRFKSERAYSSNNINVHSPAIIEYFPVQGNVFNSMNIFDDIVLPSLIHLNGIAGFYHNESFKKYINFFINNEAISFNEILNLYKDEIFRTGNQLNFAWENNPISKRAIELAKKIALGTEILVVIGYSFPFFNREIDKEIFESLKSNGIFSKIYYQDPVKSGEFLRNQFELSDNIEIKDIKEVGNYYVPFEL